MIKKFLSSAMVLVSVALFSQSVVRGEVQDASGNMLSGVSVSVDGSDQVALTDAEGKFNLEITDAKGMLTFALKDYKTFRRSAKSNENIVVVLKEDTKEISELVISAAKKLEVNKLNIKNLEAPMTINVLNHAALQKWDINNFETATKYVAGINSVKQYGGFQFFNIRGFDNFVVLYDGIRDERHSFFVSAPMPNLANIERIEILKGPSGEMFGHSALGGMINVIRKRPTYETHGDAKYTIGSYNTHNATVGIGGPITDKIRYRMDFGTLNTDGFKGIKEKSSNASVMVEFTPNEKNAFEVFYQYDNALFGPDTGVPANDNGTPISWIDPLFNYANNQDYLKYEKHEAYFKYKYKHSRNYQLDLKASYLNDDYDYLMDEVLFIDNDTKKVSRRNYGGYHFNRLTDLFVANLDHNLRFETGGIKHRAIIGNQISTMDKPSYYGAISVGENDADIANLGLGQKKLNINKWQSIKEISTAIYFQDWVEFSDRFKALIGLRYDYLWGKYDYGTYDPVNDETIKRGINEAAIYTKIPTGNLTYRGALSYQLVKNLLNTYVSASSFFKPTRSHDHKTGKIFIPETGFQIEGGLKLEKKNKVNVTLSAFYIEKNNLIVGHNIRTQVGKATSSGFEIDGDAEIIKGLYAKVGYAYTNAKFGKGTTKGDVDISGKRTSWTPEHTFNAWLNYEPAAIKGLGFGLGAFYTGKTFQNELNTQYLPAYTITNGTVYYETKNRVRIGLNVENLFNKRYYNNALSSNDLWNSDDPKAPAVDAPYQSQMQIYPGRDRNYKLSLSYSF